VVLKTLLVVKDNAETVIPLQYQKLYRRKQSWEKLSFKQCVLEVIYSTLRAVAQNNTELRKDRVRNFLSPSRKVEVGRVTSWKVQSDNMFYCLRAEVA
jgi:hypothetical protein